MKTKIFLFISILLLLVSFNSRAAETLAVQVERHYNALTSWSSDFDQETYVDMLKKNLIKPGRIVVERPDKLRIEYTEGLKKIYTSNGKKLWIYKEAETTAEQFDDPKKVISKEALSFLGGLHNLTEIFDVVPNLKDVEATLQIKDANLKKLALIPKDQEAAILKITLGVDAKDLSVREALLYNASGNVSHYTFKNVVFDQKIDAANFELPKEPKRKIIER